MRLMLLILGSVFVWGSAPGLARADYYYAPDYGYYGAPMSNYINNSYLLNSIILDDASGGDTEATAPAAPARTKNRGQQQAPLHFTPVGRNFAPATLAQSYPVASRAMVQDVFEQILTGYYKLEAQFGLKKYDLAGATAAFIAGNYSALHGQSFPDAYFPPLVEQMRKALQDNGTLHTYSNASLQEYYETMAIIGTYMALLQQALDARPDAAMRSKVSAAAASYLRSFLNVDPARISISSTGMSVR